MGPRHKNLEFKFKRATSLLFVIYLLEHSSKLSFDWFKNEKVRQINDTSNRRTAQESHFDKSNHLLIFLQSSLVNWTFGIIIAIDFVASIWFCLS